MPDPTPTLRRVIAGTAELRTLVGQELGRSDWTVVDQAMIDEFAETTGDRQWIHVDPARAAEESPFGGTIAHGYLILSLGAGMADATFDVIDVQMTINYGVDRVRFLSPVPAGARVRMRTSLHALREHARGLLAEYGYEFEFEGSTTPACVARTLALHLDHRQRSPGT